MAVDLVLLPRPVDWAPPFLHESSRQAIFSEGGTGGEGPSEVVDGARSPAYLRRGDWHGSSGSFPPTVNSATAIPRPSDVDVLWYQRRYSGSSRGGRQSHVGEVDDCHHWEQGQSSRCQESSPIRPVSSTR